MAIFCPVLCSGYSRGQYDETINVSGNSRENNRRYIVSKRERFQRNSDCKNSAPVFTSDLKSRLKRRKIKISRTCKRSFSSSGVR